MKTHKQMIYLMAVDILRRWGYSGDVPWDVLERINQKNAEKMDCSPVSLLEFAHFTKNTL